VVGRALLNVGYFIMVLTGWVSQNIFAPLLDAVNNQTGLLVGPLVRHRHDGLGLHLYAVGLSGASMW
jgi:hypothetical protein